MVSRNVALKVQPRHGTIYTVVNTIFSNLDENKTVLELYNRIFSGTIYQIGTDISQASGGEGVSVRF